MHQRSVQSIKQLPGVMETLSDRLCVCAAFHLRFLREEQCLTLAVLSNSHMKSSVGTLSDSGGGK